jgi:hypothetical protein
MGKYDAFGKYYREDTKIPAPEWVNVRKTTKPRLKSTGLWELVDSGKV